MPTKTDGQELAKLAIYSIVGLAGMVVGGMFIGKNIRENRDNNRRRDKYGREKRVEEDYKEY